MKEAMKLGEVELKTQIGEALRAKSGRLIGASGGLVLSVQCYSHFAGLVGVGGGCGSPARGVK